MLAVRAAFTISGTNAAYAVPYLTRLALNTNSEAIAWNGVFALSAVGPAGQAPLEAIFTNTSYPFRIHTMDALVPRGPSGSAHLLPLIMRDPDPNVRLIATNTLLGSGLNPDEVFKNPD